MSTFSKSTAVVALVAIIGASSTGSAQVSEKKTLTLAGARTVIAATGAQARKNGSTGAIAVVDDGGALIAMERLDGTFAAAANIALGKARTAALFRRPTKVFEDIIASGRTAMVAMNDFTPLQGGIPLMVDGEVVGAVGVSGARSAQDDEDLALAGARALQGGDACSKECSESVAYFDGARVASAFARGEVLFEAGRNYMVHASRREQAGEAEVHARDTDIIHVLGGTATVVTGGKVVEPRATADDEVRGKEISGGEARRITAGDVIIIPAGTPHWFKEVQGPVTYYVVKVR